jgi:hypothetical protein
LESLGYARREANAAFGNLQKSLVGARQRNGRRDYAGYWMRFWMRFAGRASPVLIFLATGNHPLAVLASKSHAMVVPRRSSH